MKKNESFNPATPLTDYGQKRVGRVLKELGKIWGLEKEKELLNIRTSQDDIKDKKIIIRGSRHLWWMNAEDLDYKDVANILERLKYACVIHSYEYIINDDEKIWNSDREYYEVVFPRDFDQRSARYQEEQLGKEYSTPNVSLATQPKESPLLGALLPPKASHDDDASAVTVHGVIALNKKTGYFSFNRISGNLNPTSKEFKLLLTLMTSENLHATYDQLIHGGVSKSSKRLLGFTLKNLKAELKILPKKNAKNKDIFVNIKRYGYKLAN